jgi:CheY-like chemotaxis protein
VKSIVDRHEGRLILSETQGPPGVFEICLPMAARPSDKTEMPAPAHEIEGGSETILLVEDEAFLRRVTVSCLRRLGYAVLDAGEGGAAMKLWNRHRDKIDLLFADFLLPGPETGLDLARRMNRGKASLKVILSSGNSMNRADFPEEDRRKIFHLKKPYTAGDLARFVRECLDAESAVAKG